MAESSPPHDPEGLIKAKKVHGRYVIPWGGQRPSMGSVIWWQMTDRNSSGVGGTWKEFWKFNEEELDKNLPVVKPNLHTLENPHAEELQVTWIGHATCLIQMHGLNILTDPLFNDYCGPTRMLGAKRYRPVPCKIDELPQIDAVIISHNHYDHLDYKSVVDLNKKFGDKTHWYVPMGQKDWMKSCGCANVVELEWWEQSVHPKNTGDKGVTFVFTPAQHWCRRSAMDENKALWGSWSVIGPKYRFFFGGDTGYCEVFKAIGKKYGPFDLAALPIGAYHPRWFMKFQHVDPQEAVIMHKDLQAKQSLGIHWGTFVMTNEHYLAPCKELKEALDAENIPQSKFFVMKHGETKSIGKDIRQTNDAINYETTT